MRPYVASQAGRGSIGKGPYATVSGLTGQSRQHREGTVCDRMRPNKPVAAAQGRDRLRPYVASHAGRGGMREGTICDRMWPLRPVAVHAVNHKWPYA